MERGHLSTSRKMIGWLGWFFSVCTSSQVAVFCEIEMFSSILDCIVLHLPRIRWFNHYCTT